MCIETIYNDTIFQTSITIPKPYKGSRYVFLPIALTWHLHDAGPCSLDCILQQVMQILHTCSPKRAAIFWMH